MEGVDELGEQRLGAVQQCERRQPGREQCDGEPAVRRVAGAVPGLVCDGLVHVFDTRTLEAARAVTTSVDTASRRIDSLLDPESGTVRLAFLHSVANQFDAGSAESLSCCRATHQFRTAPGAGTRHRAGSGEW